MADGYGFGGEGDWKTSVLLRTRSRRSAHGPTGGTSFMEDYTYHLGAGRAEDPRRAHARGLPDASPPARPSCEIHPLVDRRPRGPGPAGVRRRPGPGVVRRPGRHGRPVPPGGQRDRRRRAGRTAAALPVARAVWKPAPDLRHVGRVVADRRRPAPHGPDPGCGHRGARGLRPHAPHRTARHRQGRRPPPHSPTTCDGTRSTTGWPRACPVEAFDRLHTHGAATDSSTFDRGRRSEARQTRRRRVGTGRHRGRHRLRLDRQVDRQHRRPDRPSSASRCRRSRRSAGSATATT